MKYAVIVAISVFLSACDSESKFKDLEQAIKRNKLNISTIVVEATKTITIADSGGPCDDNNPCNTYLPTNKTETFTAYGLTPDNQQIDISSDVIWSTSDSNKAQINQSGTLTTQSTLGNVDVIASFASIDGRATVTVSSAALTGNNIRFQHDDADVSGTTPDVTMCDTYGLKVVGDFGDSQRIITHDITWNVTVASATTSDAKVVLNESTNLAVFSSHTPTPQPPDPAAPYELQAGYQNDPADANSKVTGILTVNVIPDNFGASISVTPASQTITKDSTFQFNASATINGVNTDITNAAKWETANDAIATVENGLVKGVSEGQTTTTASCGTLAQTATVTVEVNPTLVAIDIQDTNGDTISVLNLDLLSTDNFEKDVLVMASFTNQSESDITAEITQWVIDASDGDNANPPISVALTDADRLRITAEREGTAALTVKYSGKEDTIVVNVNVQ